MPSIPNGPESTATAAHSAKTATEVEDKPVVPELPIVDDKLLQIRYDGETHAVSSEGARMVKLLVDCFGEWVPMAQNDFSKPSDVKKKLPEQIKSLIKAEKGKGYRIARR